MARLTLKKLKSIYDTGSNMEKLVRECNYDICDLDHLNIFKMFRYVANLPYIPDLKGVEILHRPKYLRLKTVKYRDCDDKAILMGAWLFRHGIPFRFVAVSNKKNKDLHHVLIQIKTKSGALKIIDATYPKNKIFMYKPITNRKEITGWITR